MRLICPNCDAQYEVDDAAIPESGRDVQCSNCGHAWFQMHAGRVREDAETIVEPATPSKAGDASPAASAAKVGSVADPGTTATPPAGPVRRTLDDNLLAVLREEAAREAAVRRAEGARPIETQPDLGLQEVTRRAPDLPVTATAAATAAATATPAVAVPDHPVTERPTTRRDLLPDIEEINSTLRPGSEARDDNDEVALPPAPRRTAFRTGFLSVLVVAVLLVIPYAMAPQLSARFPAMAPALAGYVVTVDGLRVWLDTLMQSAAGGLRGLTSEN